jgi:hypothetical protein
LASAPANSSGSSTFSVAVNTGMRLKAWKMKPIDEARWRVRRASDSSLMASPLTTTLPLSMSSSPERQLRRVVLPDPEGPITATNWPAGTDRSMPFSASTDSAPVR